MRRHWPLLLLLAGCATGPGPDIEEAPSAELGQEFQLEVGHSIPLHGTGYRVAFDQVIEDSRCPVGTTCIWEGNAKLAVRLAPTVGDLDRALPAELNTSSRFPTKIAVDAFTIELRRLDPGPPDGTPNSGYVATLLVSKP
jgi:hypothetical protein